MSYPETVNLPFNGEIIRSRFTQIKPDGSAEPPPGYWVLLQGEKLLLRGNELCHGELPVEAEGDGAPLLFGQWDGQPVRLYSVPNSSPLPSGLQAVHWTELPDGRDGHPLRPRPADTLLGEAEPPLFPLRQPSHAADLPLLGQTLCRLRP